MALRKASVRTQFRRMSDAQFSTRVCCSISWVATRSLAPCRLAMRHMPVAAINAVMSRMAPNDAPRRRPTERLLSFMVGSGAKRYLGAENWGRYRRLVAGRGEREKLGSGRGISDCGVRAARGSCFVSEGRVCSLVQRLLPSRERVCRARDSPGWKCLGVCPRGLRRLAQKGVLELPVGGHIAQPDAQQRVEDLRLLERLARGLALDRDHRAGTWYPVDHELVARLQLLVVREDLAHAQHARDELGERCAVHVVLHAAREQLAQLGGVDLAQHGDAHALGALQGHDFSGSRGLLFKVQACGVHLEHGLVANPCAIELKAAATQAARLFILDVGHGDGLGNSTGRQQAGHGCCGTSLEKLHAQLLKKNGRSFQIVAVLLPGRNRVFEWLCVLALRVVNSGTEKSFATLWPMFIHHVFITGCSDRGAWPWRQPVALNA